MSETEMGLSALWYVSSIKAIQDMTDEEFAKYCNQAVIDIEVEKRMGLSREFTYIAVPYTSDDDTVMEARYIAVSRAAAHFKSLGLLVLSPVSHGHSLRRYGDAPVDWKGWAILAKAFLRHSKAMYILTLEGWRESVGVQAEIEVARALGIPIFLVDPETYEVCMFDDGNEVKVVAFRYEEMADFFHAQWCDWMKWMVSKAEKEADGSVRIPASWVKRWERQILTDYNDLPDKEQNSDRKQVDIFIRRFGAD